MGRSETQSEFSHEPWRLNSVDLSGLGLDTSTEEGNTLRGWVVSELASDPPKDCTCLPVVIGRLREFYADFMDEFGRIFLAENTIGERWVKHDLRKHFGFAPPQAVEAVLEHIRGRRGHLLDGFRNKYLKSMFGVWAFDRTRLRGYFRRVAWFESRHASLERALFVVGVEGFNGVLTPVAEAHCDTEALRARTESLRKFWSQKCFSKQMLFEGLVSRCLGHLTGEQTLEDRCWQYLDTQLPIWQEKRDRLMTRRGQLLDRYNREQTKVLLLPPAERDAAQEVLGKLYGKLEKVRTRMNRHDERLFPRVKDLDVLLAGSVTGTVGSVRFRRIGVEIDLFEKRVKAELARFRHDKGPLGDLANRIAHHLANRPTNAREHGISATEKRAREGQQQVWLNSGAEIVRRAQTLLMKGCEESVWLADILDLYQLGILDRVGVVGGLRRQGWRLDSMLRVN